MEHNGRFTLQWHITHRCNLRCAHCYQDDYDRMSSRDELKEVLDKYLVFCRKNNYAAQINLTGGEPLTHPDFFWLIEEFSQLNIPFSILTNGTLIDEYTAARIAMRHPIWVQVSLDGTRVMHDRIRGEGAYEAAFRGIDTLKRSGVDVIVAFTAQNGNVSSFLPLALICRLHRVDLLWWDRVVSENEEVILQKKDFEKMLKLTGRLHKLLRNSQGNGMVGGGRALQFLACPDSQGYVCSAGRSLVAVLSDGSVMPCRRLPYIIGNIRDGELEEILNNSEVCRELCEGTAPEDCQTCPQVSKCGGGSRCVSCAVTGSPFEKDPYCPRINSHTTGYTL